MTALPPAKFKLTLPINRQLTSTDKVFQYPYEFAIKGRGAYDYEWIFILGCILCFTMAAANGANDVANSFATSVGSRALKMWQAVLIASVCEFGGAYLLGARVTATIRSNIAAVNAFIDHDDLLMFGMMVTLLTVTVWVFYATYIELPVSITHSTIGAIIGFALCSPGGVNSVSWNDVGLVVASWFVSPVLSGVIAFALFWVTRRFVLRSENSFERALNYFPIMVFLMFAVNLLLIIFKAIGDFKLATGKFTLRGLATGGGLTLEGGMGIVFGLAGAMGLIFFFVGKPLLRRWIGHQSDEEVALIAVQRGIVLSENEYALIKDKLETTKGPADKDRSEYSLIDRLVHQPEIDKSYKASPLVAGIHDSAEKFAVRTELAFSALQILTACFASFAHGSNDVANAVGPLEAITAAYTTGAGSVQGNVQVGYWTLLIGSFGLVFGLAVYGHVIIAAMGGKIVHLTPARGFCAELSFSFVVVFGSFLGIPLSTTQCIVGAITGIGLAEGRIREALNWRFLAYVFCGWVMTLFICWALSALVYSFATFAPSQIYPASKVNCMYLYGTLRNVTAGAPTTYTFTDNTYYGLAGYPTGPTVVAI